jgi:hypothetical protein
MKLKVTALVVARCKIDSTLTFDAAPRRGAPCPERIKDNLMQANPKANPEVDTDLRDKINRETARLPWSELQKHFAAGTVVFVSTELDLVDVAVRISQDDKASIVQWMADGNVAKVSDLQAQHWLASDAALWTAVVNPFVLVQPEKAATPQ